MSEKLMNFDCASDVPGWLAKKCRSCCYRREGLMSDMFSELRKPYYTFTSKVSVIIDENTNSVIAWSVFGMYSERSTPEIMVYTRTSHRRQGYGSRVVRQLLQNSGNYKKIQVYIPENDSHNAFNRKGIADSRLIFR